MARIRHWIVQAAALVLFAATAGTEFVAADFGRDGAWRLCRIVRGGDVARGRKWTRMDVNPGLCRIGRRFGGWIREVDLLELEDGLLLGRSGFGSGLDDGEGAFEALPRGHDRNRPASAIEDRTNAG